MIVEDDVPPADVEALVKGDRPDLTCVDYYAERVQWLLVQD